MTERHVETLFCDDIRQEVAGKVSFIGVYSSMLFVQSFPVVLPKLCLAVKLVSTANDQMDRIRLQVLKDDELVREMIVDEQQLAAASDSAEDSPNEAESHGFQVTQFFVVFSPMRFEKPCTLRVRLQVDDDELPGVGLAVAKLPDDQKNRDNSL